MKSIVGLVSIVFGVLWGVAGILGFINGSVGPGAMQFLIGAVFIAFGQKLRSSSESSVGDNSESK